MINIFYSKRFSYLLSDIRMETIHNLTNNVWMLNKKNIMIQNDINFLHGYYVIKNNFGINHLDVTIEIQTTF